MRKTVIGIVILLALCSLPGISGVVFYKWVDAEGKHHMTDKLDKVPQNYRSIIQAEQDHVVMPDGRAYDYDSGVYSFYEADPNAFSGPGEKDTILAPHMMMPEPADAGLYNTASNDAWRGTANPVVVKSRVEKVLSPDSVLLEGNQKLKYIGIAFPDELGPESPIYQEALNYHRQLVQGKSVAILFDKKRNDDSGNLLGFVFYGTDVFVNADMIMNGYAYMKTVAPNYEYRKLYSRLQTFARTSELGIWRFIKEEPKSDGPKAIPLYIPEGYDTKDSSAAVGDDSSTPKEVPLYIPPGYDKKE